MTTEAETRVNTATTLGTLEATRSWKRQGRILHQSLFFFFFGWFCLGMIGFGFFATLYSMQDLGWPCHKAWDLGSLTRDRTCAP